jgi:hypothetical protein
MMSTTMRLTDGGSPPGMAPPIHGPRAQSVAAISRELFEQGLGVGYPVEARYAIGRPHDPQILQIFSRVWFIPYAVRVTPKSHGPNAVMSQSLQQHEETRNDHQADQK